MNFNINGKSFYIDTEIDTDYFNTYEIVYTNQKGQHFINTKTNEVSDYRNLDLRLYNVGNFIGEVYVKNHGGLLEFSWCHMPSRVRSDRKWVVDERYFVDKNKNIYELRDDMLKEIWNQESKKTNYCGYRFGKYTHDGKSIIRSAIGRMGWPASNKIMTEFISFIGSNTFCIGNGSVEEISGRYSIYRWYSTSQKPKTKTGKQELLKEKLVKYPLSDIDESKYKVIYLNSGYRNDVHNFYIYQKINDEWGVVRYFGRNAIYNSGYYDTDGIYRCEYEKPIEKWRAYFDFNGKSLRMTSNKNGEWNLCSPSSINSYEYAYFANPDDIQNEPRISYIKDIISNALNDDYLKYNFVLGVLNFLRFPEIEQLYKLGYKKPAISIAKSRTPQADIKHLFEHTYNKKGCNLLQKSGMKKNMLKYYLEVLFGNNESESRNRYYGSYHTTIYFNTAMNVFINLYDINTFQAEKFPVYIRSVENIINWSSRNVYGLYFQMQGFNNASHEEKVNYLKKFFDNIYRLQLKTDDVEVSSLIGDTMRQYGYLNSKPEMDWMFDCVSDITRAHDSIIELYNVERAEINRRYELSQEQRLKEDEERRKKLDEKRNKYNWEDEEYVIRLPKDSNEIVREGSLQRICIGGYVSSHANGSTNLFFVRKKSDPDFPFYAIEVDNNNRVVQIHGYANKWIGNNPEAVPSVIRWLRKNEFSCKDEILTNKATGYCKSKDNIDMPVVDGRKGV